MASKGAGNQSVSPAVVGVGVVLLVALVGWFAYANLFSGPKPPPMGNTPAEQQTTDTMSSLAKKCQGDFSKLSPEDQATATKVAGGMASTAIAHLYQSSAQH